MSLVLKQLQRDQRRRRVRAKIKGTAERPRLSVNVTNRHLTAQIIDDSQGVTLAYVTTVKAAAEGDMTAKAVWVGQKIAAAAKKHHIRQVVFDRAGKLYHGRLQALADAARQEGLEF
ncbi:MAG TPA: 50S ribosomal protein L18 [Candidatus Saccharimonadales bacterium]|nr:50S ribosomal protein L18 [Candidatus Saccharimonadales bacterium]